MAQLLNALVRLIHDESEAESGQSMGRGHGADFRNARSNPAKVGLFDNVKNWFA